MDWTIICAVGRFVWGGVPDAPFLFFSPSGFVKTKPPPSSEGGIAGMVLVAGVG